MTYRDALEELIVKTKAHEPPEEVVRALACLFERPEKLFCFVPNPNPTVGSGALNVASSLQASNLLVELVLAVRALDWEVVIVASEQHGETPELGATIAD